MLFLVTVVILIITLIINGFLFFVSQKSTIDNHSLKSIFRIHIVCIAAWDFFILLLLLVAYSHDFPIYYSGEVGYILAQLVFTAATLLFITNYWFVQYFIWGRFRHFLLNYAVVILQIVTLGLSVTINTLYTSIKVEPAGFVSLDILPYNAIYGFFLLVHLVVPLWLLFWHGKLEENEEKGKQYQILFIFYLLFLITCMFFNWVLPVYFGIFNFNAYGPTMSVILVTGIVYGIMRYHFLGIRMAIQLGLIYTLLFGLAATLYVSILNVIGIFTHSTLQINALTAGLITTTIGIFTIAPLDLYLRRLTHPWFFKGNFDYSDTLYELSETLQRTLLLDEIIEYTTRQLVEIFGASHVRIVLHDKKQQPLHECALRLPLVTSKGTVGEIQLGDKQSGENYSRKDRQMLSTFVNQMSISIERAQLYEAVYQHNLELEQKVADRTKKLEALQLYQKEMLDEISHGLQTPLTAITNRLDALSPYITDRSLFVSFAHFIHSLTLFIQKLLHLSNLEVVSKQEKHKPFNLSMLLMEIMEYSEISLQQENIRFHTRIEPDIFILGDTDKITEMIHIFLSNATKFRNPNAQHTVSLSLEKKEDAAVISVHDTGIGIASSHLPQIFKKFYRVRDSAHLEIEGFGLGLSIVDAVVRQHNGTVAVESKVNEYTLFTVRLQIYT